MRVKINRMMIGVSLLMMTFSLTTVTYAETCKKVPTCAELGYTQTSCGDMSALKCPFDQTKLFCASQGACAVGEFAFSDGTCSTVKVAGKTIVGVVVYPGGVFGLQEYSVTNPTTENYAEWYCNNKVKLAGREWHGRHYGFQSANLSKINNAISAAGGTPISGCYLAQNSSNYTGLSTYANPDTCSSQSQATAPTGTYRFRCWTYW